MKATLLLSLAAFAFAPLALAGDAAIGPKRFADGLPVCLALPPASTQTEVAAVLGAMQGVGDANFRVDCVFGVGGGGLLGSVWAGAGPSERGPLLQALGRALALSQPADAHRSREELKEGEEFVADGVLSLMTANPIPVLKGAGDVLRGEEAASEAQRQAEQQAMERAKQSVDQAFAHKGLDQLLLPFGTAILSVPAPAARARAEAPKAPQPILVVRGSAGGAILGTLQSGFERVAKLGPTQLACDAFPNAHVIAVDIDAPPANARRSLACPFTAIALNLDRLPPQAQLGLMTRTLPSGDGPPPGIIVDAVTSGSAAANAALRLGDVVTQLDGVSLREASDLSAAIDERAPGAVVQLTLLRKGVPQKVSAILGPRKGPPTPRHAWKSGHEAALRALATAQ